MIRKLLCAIDGSAASSKAADVAVELARQFGASLVFLTVEHASRADVAQSPFWDSQIIGAADAQTHRVLGQALARAQAGGVDSAECATTQGTNIAAAICSYAEHLEADLIVVGSVGLTGLARLVLGSVAQDVAAKAYCPVTIVR